MMRRPKQKGFTLAEVTVALAIIGLFTSIVMASVSNAKIAQRNAQRNSVISQYVPAFAIAHDAANAYPSDQGDWQCVGDYAENNCWHRNSGYIFPESILINAAVEPYMYGLPIPAPHPAYDGILYRTCDNTGNCGGYTGGTPNGYMLFWFLEGTQKSCSPGVIFDGDYAGIGHTYCRYIE